jgi:hypothetical protein
LKGSPGGPGGPSGFGGGGQQFYQSNVDPHQTFRMFFVRKIFHLNLIVENHLGWC